MQNNKYSYLLILTLKLSVFFFAKTSFAQRIEKFSNFEGFNQNTVNTIAQDNYGFLWIGTPNGLIKYDGYDFTDVEINFNSHITKLYNDKKNQLWIGTKDGLVVKILSINKEYKLSLPEGFKISNIAADKEGNIWLSGQNKLFVCKLIDAQKGLFEISGNLLKKYTDISLINDFIFLNDDVLLGTNNGLLQLAINNFKSFKDIQVSNVTSFDGFKKIVNTIKKSGQVFWLGTNRGLFKTTIKENKLTILKDFNQDSYVISNNYKGLFVKCIYEDVVGNIWFGTQKNGLFTYIPKLDKIEAYEHKTKSRKAISSSIVNTLYEDEYGVLWIGTAQGGLNKLNVLQKSFYSYQNNPFNKNSISGNLTTAILEDNKGYLWVSTYNSSICRSTTIINKTTVADIKFQDLTNKFSLEENNIVRSIFQDSKGYIWFGTDSYLIFYNPKTDIYKKINVHYQNKKVKLGLCFIVHQIDENTLMFGGDVFAIVVNPWENIHRKKTLEASSVLPLKNNRAFKALSDSKDRLWLGTENGLLLLNYQNKQLSIKKNYQNEFSNGLNNNRVITFKEDNNGQFWEGTFGGGLNKIVFNDSNNIVEYKSYNKNNLLKDNVVYGVLEDQSNNLWLSTDMGICRFNTKTEKTKFFDVRDGLINNNFRQSSYFKGKSGYFYFGGLNGLTVFKPEKIRLNKLTPKVVITDLKIKNKKVEIEPKNSAAYLSKSISETEQITIHESDQVLALDVIVNHSAIPAKNKLAYKLVGFNDDWIYENTGKVTITYTNLSAGNYELEIKGANGDGLWGEKIKKIKVQVLPMWYKTWWSYLLFIAFVLISIYGIFVYFIRLEKLKQNLKYEQLDKERMDMVNQNKFRFFTNISHEFRTPLALISGPLDIVIEENKNESNAKYLAIIQKNTKRLLSLVDQLITFRQAEQGYVDLCLTETTLSEFIYSVTEAFENYAIEKNINFFYKVHSPNEVIVVDIEKVERILFNLLSNSFKNTQAKDSISIEAVVSNSDDGKIIKIDVVDTGKGIPKEKINTIFERFYQLGKKEENFSGGGIGLAFCKSLVELLGGNISAKSEPGVETRFSIFVPSKNKEDYQSDIINKEGKSFIKDWVPLTKSDAPESVDMAVRPKKEVKNLLIVEDEEDIQHFLVESLSNKYNITLASNGVEGLEKLKQKEPDLIISDVMMHEMDGFQFCEIIKKDPNTCHIPIVLLTALGEVEDTITGLELGADEYISKPFSLKHLELRLEKLIENNSKIKEYFSKNSVPPENKKNIGFSVKDLAFLEKITEIIESNLSNSNFGVEELSKEVGLSSSHFYRKLKQLTGQVPNVYIRNFRLQRAAKLITSNSGFSVAEVMYQIGIESKSYFSTSFKKLHGVSPSEYLKRQKR